MTWDEINDKVTNNNDIATISMEDLKKAHGAERLGGNVRKEISATLARSGLGHVPTELPGNQNEQIRLYRRGTAIGDTIETVLRPGPQNDQKLIEQFTADDVNHAETIQKIRELVAE